MEISLTSSIKSIDNFNKLNNNEKNIYLKQLLDTKRIHDLINFILESDSFLVDSDFFKIPNPMPIVSAYTKKNGLRACILEENTEITLFDFSNTYKIEKISLFLKISGY